MLLAGINILYLTFEESWALERGDDAPLTVKSDVQARDRNRDAMTHPGTYLP